MPSSSFFPVTEEGYRPCVEQDDYEITIGHRFSAFYGSTLAGTVIRIYFYRKA
jgi:hypothetical protein